MPEPLRALLPGGLSRQRVTAIGHGIGATSLAMALTAAGTEHGGWVGVVGVPRWGVLVAHELGVACERTALVPDPGERWAAVLSALAEGMRMVVAQPVTPLTQKMRIRLQTRARQTDCVLLILGNWPEAAVQHSTSEPRWHGIWADGHGRLARRELTVAAVPRSARAASTTVWLPDRRGRIAEPAPTRLVECWQSGSRGRDRIRLGLEDAGDDGRVATQDGPDGIFRRCYHNDEARAVAQLQQVIDQHNHLTWRDVTETSQPLPSRQTPSVPAASAL
ncbi:hypothetical protein NUM_07690 [Actinocatenispora comari]|uniref:Uncharacterized protein n=1 Tax=Actinocatenispora comari TaxID=2807577 RepID=A0A8J4A5S5_9ACTN|nr:hypothetical protein NUM_07690 [Actinocatenispora comari]